MVLLVHHHGVGFPGVPQLAHAVDELVGHVVAQVVLDLLVEAVILRRRIAGGGDDVPGDASARVVVERRERACQQPRRIEGRGERRCETDMLGCLDQIGRQHHRIELRRHGRMLEVEIHAALVGVGHRRGILENEHIEAGALQRAGGIDKDVGLRPVVTRGEARLVPALDRNAGAEEPTEVKFAHGMELRVIGR